MALPLPTSLSPSKVSTFKDCALAFRFSAIDKLPEPPSVPAVKGTTVHRALELLLLDAPDDRTPERAQECLQVALQEMANNEEYLGLELDDAGATDFAATASRMVERYFTLEDPRRINPIGLELFLTAQLGSLTVRGATPGPLISSGTRSSSSYTVDACLTLPCSPNASPWSDDTIT